MGFMVISYLANHQNLVRLGKLGKLLQRRHETLVIVSAAGRVNQDHVKLLLGSKRDGILCHGCGVFAVTLLVQLYLAALTGREF